MVQVTRQSADQENARALLRIWNERLTPGRKRDPMHPYDGTTLPVEAKAALKKSRQA